VFRRSSFGSSENSLLPEAATAAAGASRPFSLAEAMQARVSQIWAFFAVLRIRDVYPGSRIRFPGSASKNLNPGCSSRIPDPDADFLPIMDPGFRGQKGTGSRIWILNSDFLKSEVWKVANCVILVMESNREKN
jgi:hypothetical protein